MTDQTAAQAVAPTPDQIRAARQAAGLSQTAAAAVIYKTLRGWQEWEAGNRQMDPAFWELFQLKTKRQD
jgi:DNA-binding transcriptional regulator YiaG